MVYKPTALHHHTTTSSVFSLQSLHMCLGKITWGGYLWRRAAAQGASSRPVRVVGQRLLLDHPRTHPSCPSFRPTGMGGCPCGQGAVGTRGLRCGRRREGLQPLPDGSVPSPSCRPKKYLKMLLKTQNHQQKVKIAQNISTRTIECHTRKKIFYIQNVLISIFKRKIWIIYYVCMLTTFWRKVLS